MIPLAGRESAPPRSSTDFFDRLPEEARLNWSRWIRQIHRWVSIIFTVTVIANFVALSRGEPPAWITYSPLPPLFLLLFTGLYLFVLPYLRRRAEGRAAGGPRPGLD